VALASRQGRTVRRPHARQEPRDAVTMRRSTRSWARGGGGQLLAVTVSPYGPPPPITSEVSMSRYSIPPQQPGLTAIVGWDNPVRRVN
jgi:hypothetical protein